MRKSFLVLIVCFSVAASAQKMPWTLRQCVDTALQNNIAIGQSRLSNEIDKVNFSESKAKLLPDLNASDNHNFNFGRSSDPFTNQFVNQNVSNNNLGLSSSLTLFNGFQTINSIKRDRISVEAGAMDVAKAQNDIILNVCASYLQILFAYEQLDISNKQLDETQKQVERTKLLYNVGKLAEGSLLQINAQWASQKLAVVNAENQLIITKVNLMQLMEKPIDYMFEVERPIIISSLLETDTTIISSDSIYKEALKILPQIKSVELKSKEAEVNMKIAKGMYLPRLYLNGSISTGYSSSNKQISYNAETQIRNIGYLTSNPFESVSGPISSSTRVESDYSLSNQFKDNRREALMFSLNVPIFTNKRTSSQLAISKINFSSAKLNEEYTKNQLRKSIEQSYIDYLSAQRRYEAELEQLVNIEKSYSNTESKFALGMVNIIEFLIEKNNLLKSQSNLLQSKYDFVFKKKVLDFYLGKDITQ